MQQAAPFLDEYPIFYDFLKFSPWKNKKKYQTMSKHSQILQRPSSHFSKRACKKSRQDTISRPIFPRDTSSRKPCFLLPGEKKLRKLFRGGPLAHPPRPQAQHAHALRARPTGAPTPGTSVRHMGAPGQGRVGHGAAGRRSPPPAVNTAGGHRRRRWFPVPVSGAGAGGQKNELGKELTENSMLESSLTR